jgi:xanthine phosphoribosyltransferase
MGNIEKKVLSFDEVVEDVCHLAQILNQSNKEFDRIIGISRGGIFPSLILGRELNIKNIHTIIVSGYTDDIDTGQRKIHYYYDDFLIFDHSKTLVVDDLSDTGKTIEEVRKILPNCTYVTVYAKPLGSDHPDFSAVAIDNQDTWLVFPWE